MRPTVQYGHLCNVATRAIRPPVQYGHPCNTATRALWLPVQYGPLCTRATRAIRPPLRYSHARNLATPAIRPPVQYGHLQGPASSCSCLEENGLPVVERDGKRCVIHTDAAGNEHCYPPDYGTKRCAVFMAFFYSRAHADGDRRGSPGPFPAPPSDSI